MIRKLLGPKFQYICFIKHSNICPVWNKLPEQIVSAPNLTAFKSLFKLDLHTLTSLNIY